MPTLLNTGAWIYVVRILVTVKYYNWSVEVTVIIIIIIIIIIIVLLLKTVTTGFGA